MIFSACAHDDHWPILFDQFSFSFSSFFSLFLSEQRLSPAAIRRNGASDDGQGAKEREISKRNLRKLLQGAGFYTDDDAFIIWTLNIISRRKKKKKKEKKKKRKKKERILFFPVPFFFYEEENFN
jgi:hypothetical protein